MPKSVNLLVALAVVAIVAFWAAVATGGVFFVRHWLDVRDDPPVFHCPYVAAMNGQCEDLYQEWLERERR